MRNILRRFSFMSATALLNACPTGGIPPAPGPSLTPAPKQNPGVWGGVAQAAIEELLKDVWDLRKDRLNLTFNYPKKDDPAYDPATAMVVRVQPTSVPVVQILTDATRSKILKQWSSQGYLGLTTVKPTSHGMTLNESALDAKASRLALPFLSDAFELSAPIDVRVSLGAGSSAKTFTVPFQADLIFSVDTAHGEQVVRGHTLARYAPALAPARVQSHMTAANIAPQQAPTGAASAAASCKCDAGSAVSHVVSYVVNELAMPILQGDLAEYLNGVPLFQLQVDKLRFSALALTGASIGKHNYLVAGANLIPVDRYPSQAVGPYDLKWSTYAKDGKALFACIGPAGLDAAVASELALDPVASIHRSGSVGQYHFGVDVTLNIKNPRFEVRQGARAELEVDLDGLADAYVDVPGLGRMRIGLEMTSVIPPTVAVLPRWDAASNSVKAKVVMDGVATVQFKPTDDVLSILTGPLLSFLDSTLAPSVEKWVTGILSVASQPLEELSLPIGETDPTGKTKPYEVTTQVLGESPDDVIVLKFQPTAMKFSTIDGNLCAVADASIDACGPKTSKKCEGSP